ncbi:uncharacterized protein LOC121377542 [Gigantopelta aegis]|uniref:uncharacterized protein LOC121377542 n=1 Tax=Gigantopelta aegis TaxID=1735272 RepID=UPI001B888B9D|nr:uncharacterized protein LOC121377542 [Gigantopelta aegis]
MNRPVASGTTSVCYCCCSETQANAPSNSMDVDAALHELGMLSTVTDSRHQFLKERNRTVSENSAVSLKPQNGYHIVQIDKHYVTGVSVKRSVTVHKSPSESALHNDTANVGVIDGLFTHTPAPDSPPFLSRFPEHGNCTGNESRGKQLLYKAKQVSPLELQASANRLARVKLSRAYRHQRPYSLSGRLYHSMHEGDFHVDEQSDRNQSKSNVSSPVKGVDDTQLLPRSRSLDNLDMAKLKLTDLFDSEINGSESQSMEDVSRDLEKLQVNN